MPVDLGPRRQTGRLQAFWLPVGCAALLVLGLVRSAVICLRRQPDADMATVPLIDEAIRAHGLSVLSAWHYTQDNWLLSVILPELPLQAALAPCPWLPALTGWLFFVGCCATVGLLARPATGPVAALLLGTTLLFASPAALTGFGFLAHPTSHDVSSFWCLLALLPAMACLRGRSPPLLLATAAALLVATLSDPWTRAAFLLPISAASLVAAVALAGRMRRVAVLIALATLPSWLSGSHAFGLMPSLTALHFDRGPWSAVPAHLRAALLGLGLLFGIGTPAPPAAGTPPGAAVALVALALLGTLAVATLLPRADRLRGPDGFLMLVCVLSGAGTVAAFGLSAMPADPAFTRLVLNLYFVLPLFLCLALAGTRRGAGQAALLAAALLFIAGGLGAPWMPVREHSVGAPGWQTRLTRFLRAHDLRYGYGGYWGSDANSSRVRTRGAITIRPVSGPGGLLPIQPTGSQTFDAWYGPGDAGSVRTRFFVSVPDPDLCGDSRTCRILSIRSFGRPDQILDWEGHDILVWSHPVLFRMPDASVLEALPPPGSAPSSGIALLPYLWTGWTLPDGNGSWMRGQHAVLMLPPALDADAQCLVLRAASGPEGGPVQSLRLRDGDTVLASWKVPPGLPTRHCVPRHARGAALVLEHGPEDGKQPAWILLASIGAKTVENTP